MPKLPDLNAGRADTLYQAYSPSSGHTSGLPTVDPYEAEEQLVFEKHMAKNTDKPQDWIIRQGQVQWTGTWTSEI